MSTSAPDSNAAADDAFAYLQTIGIPQAVQKLIEMQGVAMRHGESPLRQALGEVINGLLRDVNEAAVKYAALADGYIVTKILQTHSRNRPLVGDMQTHIRSEPGPLGLVKVALVAELDKIVNPNGYGPFWRAQEYGTGSPEVASQVGRPLFGTFEPSGEPPDSAQRGLGEGHDLAFIPMGDAPGFGRISVDLPGRHFLRDGATEAGTRYIEAMAVIQQKWLARLREIVALAKRRGGGASYTGIIRA